jgi:acetyl esterase/lipase
VTPCSFSSVKYKSALASTSSSNPLRAVLNFYHILFKMLDPQIASVLREQMSGAPLLPKPPVGDVTTRRNNSDYKYLLEGACEFHSDVEVKDFHTPAPDGHSILLRWYTKKNSSPGAAILFNHGGGMIIGCVEHCDNLLSQYVSLSGVPMLSVQYRLAPEAQYPVPVLDVYSGLKWLHEHAAELGVDTERIGIAGDSAGGGLSAACCLWSREHGGPKIKKQFLNAPMLDDRNIHENPHLKMYLPWNHIDNETGWGALLGPLMGQDDVPETAAPGRMVKADGMPPLYMDVGDLDFFIQEDLDYVVKHLKAGVSVELHLRPGCPHAYDFAAASTDVAKRSIADRVEAFKTL